MRQSGRTQDVGRTKSSAVPVLISARAGAASLRSLFRPTFVSLAIATQLDHWDQRRILPGSQSPATEIVVPIFPVGRALLPDPCLQKTGKSARSTNKRRGVARALAETSPQTLIRSESTQALTEAR